MQHAKRFFTLQHSTPNGSWIDYTYYINLHNAETDCKECTERDTQRHWRIIQHPIEE